MAQQTINVGATPNDSTGDPIRTAFTKSNANFTEIYAGLLEPPQGRLTLASATPVMVSTVSGATTIYYTPYVGNIVPIYDGTNMNATAFSELSVALSDSTKNPAAVGASKVNDWFVWNDAGGTIRLGHGPDWASDTARTDALVRINGIWLNNVSITNGPGAQRGTWVGTTRSNASSQIDWIFGGISAGGTQAWFGVWNAYNRVDVKTQIGDSTASWAYAVLGTIRSANASAAMRCSFVAGLAEDAFFAQYICNAANAVSGTIYYIGVGYDATSAFSGVVGFANAKVGDALQLQGMFTTTALGFHFFQACEALSGSASTLTFYGNTSAGLGQTGMTSMLRM